MNLVIDTSALLALLWQEPGWQTVAQALHEANSLMSTVNLAELVAKTQEHHPVSESDVRSLLAELPITIVPYDADQAITTGILRNTTRTLGLSLGDRACLALAQQQKAPALTADRLWLELADPLNLDIRYIRPA